MRFIKKNFWTMLAMVFVFSLSLTGDAAAVGSFFSTTKNKLLAVFFDVKNVVFIIGGFGLVAVAFAAIFGKVNWKWFAGLAAGLAILAAASMAIQYVTGDSTNSVDYGAGMQDSFGN